VSSADGLGMPRVCVCVCFYWIIPGSEGSCKLLLVTAGDITRALSFFLLLYFPARFIYLYSAFWDGLELGTCLGPERWMGIFLVSTPAHLQPVPLTATSHSTERTFTGLNRIGNVQ